MGDQRNAQNERRHLNLNTEIIKVWSLPLVGNLLPTDVLQCLGTKKFNIQTDTVRFTKYHQGTSCVTHTHTSDTNK